MAPRRRVRDARVAIVSLKECGRGHVVPSKECSRGPHLLEGVADVLGLGGRLGAPPDDADLLDVLPCLLEERELVAAALEDGLLQKGSRGAVQHRGTSGCYGVLGACRRGRIEATKRAGNRKRNQGRGEADGGGLGVPQGHVDNPQQMQVVRSAFGPPVDMGVVIAL